MIGIIKELLQDVARSESLSYYSPNSRAGSQVGKVILNKVELVKLESRAVPLRRLRPVHR
jgi:hypothetical protein